MAASSIAGSRQVEAVRYALLRRLALAMRHHMVVHLQPMSMITELLDRRVRNGSASIEQVHQAMGKIHDLSRAAVDSCTDMVTWLAPPAGMRIALDEGVAECLSLLRSNFSFRGFPLDDVLGGAKAQVERSALRHVLPAVLLALTDRAPPPADVCVRTLDQAGGIVTVEVRPKAGEPGFPGNHPYRLIDWQEVEALAQAEGVRVTREGELARIEFPA